MSNSQLNTAALLETVRTLSVTASIDESAAAELLNKKITITMATSNRAAIVMANELSLLLSRTFVSVAHDMSKGSDLEIIIGATSLQQKHGALHVGWDSDTIVIGAMPHPGQSLPDLHPIYLLLGACYAAAAATKYLTGQAIPQPLPDPLVVNLDQLGIEREWLTREIFLADTYVAGAGAISNGLLKAFRYLEVHGQLNIADDDIVDDTNLQRQVFFTDDDIGTSKAFTLAAKAQPYFPNLVLNPHKCRLQDLRSNDNDRWLQRLIVCVDSRRARRELQNEIPGEVFDASTTDIREVIVHYHKQPTSESCMSCIYSTDHAEIRRETLLANGLGLSQEQIQKQYLDHHAAETVIQYLELEALPDAYVGLACDTLFKQLCGEGLLKIAPDKQILAPFAFVSVLAGTLLAIEIVRRLTGAENLDDNYWRVGVWSPPISALRKQRKRIAECSFCGNPYLHATMQSLWATSSD